MILAKVFGLCGLFYCAYLVSYEVFSPPSRRLCNMTFVLYHTASVLAGQLMGILMDLIHESRQTNMVEDAINYNQFQFFIWCNLLTGLFNLTIKTYYSSVLVSHIVMFVYYLISVYGVGIMRKCRCCKNIIM